MRLCTKILIFVQVACSDKHRKHFLVNRVLLEQQLETEWLKRHTLSNEMFTHSFNPVQSQAVQHGGSTLHDTEDSNGEQEPEPERDNNHDDS